MPTKKRSCKKSSASPTEKKQKVKTEVLTNADDDVEAPVKSEAKKVRAPVRSEAKKARSPVKSEEKKVEDDDDGEESRFIGAPVSDDEAKRRWPHRYLAKDEKNKIEPLKEFIQAKRHFTEALVDGRVHFKLGDDGYVHAGDAKDVEHYICRVVEMFEGVDSQPYFCAQWFYRAKDTVIGKCSNLVDDRRIFISEIMDDNPLDCLLEKLKIVRVPLDVDRATKRALLGDGHFYYDMLYLVPFSSYQILPPDAAADGNESDSTISSESETFASLTEVSKIQKEEKTEMKMLDLYSGCGAMSTGLCLGANMADLNLVTKWAVDLNKYACESLRHNHPETEVRNESAEDFLKLLKEWERLCQSFSLIGGGDPMIAETEETEMVNDDEDDEDDDNLDEEVFEVDQILSICYGDPKGIDKPGLYLKIRWKNYGPEEDTWEPKDGLGDCKEKIKQFVVDGFKSKMLPLPGDVDVICGGPPCQGISGFNRFRNKENPLKDEKNQQLIVYMNIVDYLKPRFALMENVVDIVKFAEGFLGRYAMGSLVNMNYQIRMGLMTAGCYGLPQFRMRMFMWAARPNEKLPQYPLPTHKVVSRGASPKEFESNVVVHDEVNGVELEKELYLGDAISDLPPVTNYEEKDEMSYIEPAQTEFQKFIRLKKKDMPGSSTLGVDFSDHLLYDQRPYKCNVDDYERVCQIPRRKGANFRDLTGVIVGEDNVVRFDPEIPRVLLKSGNPLVPDYCMTFVDGKSSKPFGRLWWDEIVPTVVTRAEPHNQAILHPIQDRVLSVRENARLQGFPDYYKLFGPIKERYMQVGNAVAVPVARALGYSLAMSCKGTASEGPIFSLPKNFPNMEAVASPALVEEDQ